MLLAAFLVQAHPTVAPFREIIGHVYLQHRADSREGINHHADQCPIPQACLGQLIMVMGGE